MFKSEVFKSWALVLQLGISIMVPVFLMIVLAYIIRDYLKIDIMLLFVILGILAGVRNVYVILKNYLATMDTNKSKESELMRKHLKNIKNIK
ncbi:MAG: AtpZ/AtpI family protein [Lachnospiraceae bacterium]|nr:AtpZ/AtpI family protein [Lachnospiraceae bacterium]